MSEPRNQLGERVTEWIASHPHAMITEFVVTQSSDSEFHCLAITVFYRAVETRRLNRPLGKVE